MTIRNTLAALLIFVLGGAAGYVIPHRFGETIAQWNVDEFHHCLAPLKQPRYTQYLSWDSDAQQRALHSLGVEADCINTSGIAGLFPYETECASGYSLMEYDAYRRMHPSGPDVWYVEQVVRTHRKPIDADYCSGRMVKPSDLRRSR